MLKDFATANRRYINYAYRDPDSLNSRTRACSSTRFTDSLISRLNDYKLVKSHFYSLTE